ncbi:MAG: TetR/AcrR family transcriptional regulator [Alphaproteobacteria bacterium]|nr:TetR/AcrR family transcriptional regulator [Alphaproteobacteria bacterium]MBU1515397.1 TetR/AcrR family transcriptional regulator [Alphaproteobacteria bacterium]MBU2092968.1 TetR/AcrR family transcriptional regulator [Alphaproteobacteria bacterium]MBU2150128.1 TetR/AcrR family transcriptional regulator [Alphaproteobacteria bacterium]MBU2309913.1 TetR/AcrR family transcriptional regulator [Alphaproteobacteria bacterium]
MTSPAAADSVSRRAGRPRDPDIDRKLIEAALVELGAQGFAGMSIDRISERTGVGKPAIYRRFADKAALAIAAITALTLNEGPAASGDLVEDLTRQMLLAHGNLETRGSVPLLGTLLAERDRQPELIGMYRERLFAPRAAKAAALLLDAQVRGLLRDDADIPAAVLLLMGFLPASYVSGQPLDADHMRAAVRIIVAGLKA